ncbi:RNA-binding protein [Pseudochryseolinea flava]|uniref:HMA domain-containing protein n=1 Tax=Pseudochryseolinea flava TaxID=2059302 RepID=A0A364Y4G3_9BACT|nr:hypothetical protein [Pseudochryseolinea flava]RAW00695.1 hypothetical protein DQQ10_14005 [Pseudochryseolinea flava]
MKMLKVTTMLLVAGILTLFSYANLRVRSEGEKQKSVELTSFLLTGNLDSVALYTLEKKIQSTKGVRSCSINARGKAACVIYYKDMISESSVASLLTEGSISKVTKKDLSATRGGCPVHQLGASFNRFMTLLDVRTQ